MFRVYDSNNRHLGKLSDAADALLVADSHPGSTVKVGPRKGRVVVWKYGEPLDAAAVTDRAMQITADAPTAGDAAEEEQE